MVTTGGSLFYRYGYRGRTWITKRVHNRGCYMWVPTDSVDISKELSSVARGPSISDDQSNWVNISPSSSSMAVP